MLFHLSALWIKICLMRKAIPLLIILALALSVRLASVWEFKKFPLFEHPQLDEMEYDDWAKEISRGIVLRTYVPLHSPGYPFFLALIYKFLPSPYISARIFQAFISTLTVLLVFLIARKIFDPSSALVSAFLASFFWTPVYFQTRLLPTTLQIFFILLSIWIFLRLEKKPIISALLSGFSLSVAGIFWPLSISIFPAFILWMYINYGLKKSLAPALFFLIGLVVPLAPVTYQNYLAEQDWVLLQKNFGLNFYLGNNQDSPGIPYLRPGGGWDKLQAMAMLEAGAEKPSEQNKYYLKKWFTWAKQHPFLWLNLLVRKTKLLFDNREIIASFDPDFYRDRMVSLRLCIINSGLIIALGLLGLFSSRIRQRGVSLVSLSLLFFGIALILTLISARYRLAFITLLLLPAGFGIREIFYSIRSLEFSRLVLLIGALICLFIITIIPVPKLPDQSSYEYVHIGQAWLEAKDFKKATENFLQACRFSVSKSAGYLGLAKVYMDTQDWKYAEAYARTAINLDPDWAHAHLVLGKILLSRTKTEQAIQQFLTSVNLRPQFLNGWIALADALLVSDRIEEAEKAMKQIENLRPDSPSLMLLKAKRALQKQQPHEALRLLKAYLKFSPDDKIIQNMVKEIEAQTKK